MSCVEPFYVLFRFCFIVCLFFFQSFFTFSNKSPSTLVVSENTEVLFYSGTAELVRVNFQNL